MIGSDSKEAPIQELDDIRKADSCDNVLTRLVENPSDYSIRARL
ncbi:MAG: hypothetical protein QF362_02815 [Candidatus Woesearchaeota archaeon]|jgi:hypothetical protein|nr:hypothetical protein [Candidatus Woesearchaeota archaeon]MDP7506349.1 hypothetical protein [Candidatus Woesearchaeota archaeon]|tara:strand:+ start:770 stop:901 length:132 start_codon:yes stop_codon:yes gene_type:complete